MSILASVIKDVWKAVPQMRSSGHQGRYKRLHAFLRQRLAEDLYAETPDAGHTQVTHDVLKIINNRWGLRGKHVLDVGCGRGVALEKLAEYGAIAKGLTFGADYVECKRRGYDVLEMDMSFIEFPDETFDVVWARHSLEHSIFPYFTLHVLCSALKRGGLLYAEMPAPDTSANHQMNKNHYSCLTRSSWQSLFERLGLTVLDTRDLHVELRCGPDIWYSFYLQKS